MRRGCIPNGKIYEYHEGGTYEAEANLHKGVKPVFKFEVIGE